jgi:hypothetical protein
MMSGWQLIETAPKDGTRILAWDGLCMMVLWWGSGGWYDAQWVTVHLDNNRPFAPTHWMPLPEPPKT